MNPHTNELVGAIENRTEQVVENLRAVLNGNKVGSLTRRSK
mgnify:CR=1 FL=1